MSSVLVLGGVIIVVLAIAIMAVMWVKAMEVTFETSTDEIAQEKANQMYKDMVENTQYKVHITTMVIDEMDKESI